MDGTAADMVGVFGEVGEVRKIGECADHADRLVARQALEQLLQGLVGFLVGIPTEGHRQGTDFFDELISVNTFLLPDHIPQNAP